FEELGPQESIYSVFVLLKRGQHAHLDAIERRPPRAEPETPAVEVVQPGLDLDVAFWNRGHVERIQERPAAGLRHAREQQHSCEYPQSHRGHFTSTSGYARHPNRQAVGFSGAGRYARP